MFWKKVSNFVLKLMLLYILVEIASALFKMTGVEPDLTFVETVVVVAMVLTGYYLAKIVFELPPIIK